MGSQLRTAEKAIHTLRVRNRPALQRQKCRKVGTPPSPVHYVEPERLPSETFCPRKKIYAQLKARGTGFPVVDLGSLYVAKLSKSVYDVMTNVHLLCRNAWSKDELQTAKRWYHLMRRWLSHRDDIFKNSKFVRQSLRVLSITLRLTESHLRWKDSHSVGKNRDVSALPRNR